MESVDILTITECEGKYGVRFREFEGPLDLLLHLIKVEKIDIYDIPIALITERYLEYIRLMEDLNIKVAVEFLEMASTLIYIKSKMLLPVENEDLLEEEFEDPREELVERLLEYERYKELAGELYLLNEVEGSGIHRSRMEEVLELEGEVINATLFDILEAYKNVLKRLKDAGKSIEIDRDNFSLVDAISDLKKKLRKKSKLSFFHIVRDASVGKIMTYFIAILEMCKQRIVNLVQSRDYDDILVIKRKG